MAVGIIKSVEQCAITVNATQSYVDYTLTKGQVIANCVPFTTWKGTSNSFLTPDNFNFNTRFLSGPDRVRVERSASDIQYLVIVYVVEFEASKVKVQQGTWSIGNGASTDTVTLGDSITTANSALVFYTKYNSNSVIPRDFLVGGYVKSTTQVEFQRWQAATSTCDGNYYVFEALAGDFTVEHYDTGNSTAQEFNISIPAVTTSRTFLLGSYKTDNSTTAIEESTFFHRLETTTNIEVRRWANSGDNSRHWVQVIEAPDDRIFVQHRYAYGDPSTVYHEWTLPTAVDPLRAIAHCPTMFPGSRTDGSPWTYGMYRMYLSESGAKLRMERYLDSPPDDDCYFVGQVIEFTGTEYFCEGVVTVGGTPTGSIPVYLYKRDSALLVGETTTSGDGSFAIPSRFHEDYHYVVAISPVSGTNSKIVDWLYPI